MGNICRQTQKKTKGIITDGQIRRISEEKGNLDNLKVKNVMTKNPIKIYKITLATKALAIMNEKKITSLLVVSDNEYKKKNKRLKGIIHIHFLLFLHLHHVKLFVIWYKITLLNVLRIYYGEVYHCFVRLFTLFYLK